MLNWPSYQRSKTWDYRLCGRRQIPCGCEPVHPPTPSSTRHDSLHPTDSEPPLPLPPKHKGKEKKGREEEVGEIILGG